MLLSEFNGVRRGKGLILPDSSTLIFLSFDLKESRLALVVLSVSCKGNILFFLRSIRVLAGSSLIKL